MYLLAYVLMFYSTTALSHADEKCMTMIIAKWMNHQLYTMPDYFLL